MAEVERRWIDLDIKFVPITNLPRQQVTTLRPRVKADATEEPMRIIGPSGPENRHADTVTIVPKSLTKTVLKIEAVTKQKGVEGVRWGTPEAEEVGDVDAIEIGDDLEGA